MNHQPPPISRKNSYVASGKRGGFALLITITLLAFLVLLLVSLAALTRVETQVSTNNQNIAQARQNALMALNIALGQLQRHTGPDQRVTATADVVIPPSVAIAATDTGAVAISKLDTFWTGSRNRKWTGAWKNGNSDPYLPDSPDKYNPVPANLAWLVSGNEATATFNPTDVISGLTATSSPLVAINDSAGRPHRLLVKASAGITATSDATALQRAVTAPQITIESTNVPGSNGTSTPIGHYAWWVGDEGVKARVNLVDAHAASPTTDSKINRFQSAQRLAVEAMSVNGTDGLAALAPSLQEPSTLARFNAGLSKSLTADQLAYVIPATTLPADLKTRFHDISVSSRGVMSDTKHGGLKRDLTYILGQRTADDFRTALNGAFDGGLGAPPLATYNTAFSSVATPYATLPSLPLGADPGKPFADAGAGGILSFSSTWEQLWSFHNMGNLKTTVPAGVFNSAGEAVPRRQTEAEHGISPVIVSGKLLYRLRIAPGSSPPETNTDGVAVNRTGLIWMDVIPMIVVANPYDVPLAAADYTYLCSGSVPLLRFGTDSNPSDPVTAYAPINGTNEPQQSQNLVNCGIGAIRLVLRSTGMKPGEAQVFCIDRNPTVNPSITTIDGTPHLIRITSKTDSKEVFLTNEYDYLPALTWNTGKSIPADKTYAALFSSTSTVTSKLLLDYSPALNAEEKDRRLIRYSNGQQTGADLGGSYNFLLVDPVADGTKQGGGYLFAINEAATQVASGEIEKRLPMQAPFYQVNYRSPVSLPTGNAGNGPGDWARTYTKKGSAGSLGLDTLAAINVMRKSGSTRLVRWGMVNLSDVFDPTIPPASIGGAGATDIGFENLLYDIPRPGHPPASLGQLQHFNTGGFIGRSSTVALNTASNQVHGWQVNYAISNSYPQPRTRRDRVFDARVQWGYHYDGSYLWNDILWDRFYFSTYPQSGAFDFSTDQLINTRLRPFRDHSQTPLDDPAGFRGDGSPATAANSRQAAQNLLVEGAFNINSTSTEAWRALFSSLRDVPVGTETVSPGTANPNLNAPFSRTLRPIGGAPDASTGVTPNAWNGLRNLTRVEVEKLADEMVLQVRLRGPFLSLAEFVNRRLVPATTDTYGLGLAGALQTALDRTANLHVASPFNIKTETRTPDNSLADQAYIMSTALDGFPGHLLQGDVLSALGPALAPRSDTFVIRTYGDYQNPATAIIEGRAWCEAVVQRLPDYVVPKSGSVGNSPDEPATHPDNANFGRRYKIVSFRWMTPEEL